MDNPKPQAPPYRPMLKVAAVAEWLGIAERSVWQLVEDGKLVPYRVKGRAVRFSPDQIEEHLRRVAGR